MNIFGNNCNHSGLYKMMRPSGVIVCSKCRSEPAFSLSKDDCFHDFETIERFGTEYDRCKKCGYRRISDSL